MLTSRTRRTVRYRHTMRLGKTTKAPTLHTSLETLSNAAQIRLSSKLFYIRVGNNINILTRNKVKCRECCTYRRVRNRVVYALIRAYGNMCICSDWEFFYNAFWRNTSASKVSSHLSCCCFCWSVRGSNLDGVVFCSVFTDSLYIGSHLAVFKLNISIETWTIIYTPVILLQDIFYHGHPITPTFHVYAQ